MANVVNSNTVYVDATGDLVTTKNTSVVGVIVTATAASARVVLADNTSTKMDLRVATSGDSTHFDFSLNPVLFPNKVTVSTLTNGVATVIYSRGSGG